MFGLVTRFMEDMWIAGKETVTVLLIEIEHK